MKHDADPTHSLNNLWQTHSQTTQSSVPFYIKVEQGMAVIIWLYMSNSIEHSFTTMIQIYTLACNWRISIMQLQLFVHYEQIGVLHIPSHLVWMQCN